MSMTMEDARERVRALKANEALSGTDEDTVQFRNIVTAAKTVVDELGTERTRLADTGQYTETGLTLALKDAATKAATRLTGLRDTLLAPRLTRLESEIAALPKAEVGIELEPLERNRLVTKYISLPSKEKERMRARALSNPKLATALSQEDVSVTGLTEPFIKELKKKVTTDPNATTRDELQRKLNAAKAAQSAIQGATISVNRATTTA